MSRSGVALTLAMLACMGLATPLPAQNPQQEPTGFHVFGPGGSLVDAPALCPNEPPPFLHWDLRQFPGCAVPYEVNGNIPAPNNPTAAQAVAAVNLAATTWNQVAPAPVSLFNNSTASLWSQAPAQDGRNCVAWDPNFLSNFADYYYGITYIWRDTNSGVILESDVTLNPATDTTGAWT